MLSFKEFLIESIVKEYGKDVGNLSHPTKGSFTIKKLGDIHQVYNEYGDLAHTFYKKSTDEVTDHLKDNEGMHESNAEAMTEVKNDSATMNVHRGGYNEAMFAYHLNGGKWSNDEHKAEAAKHKEKLDKYHPEEAKVQEDRAKAQVKSFVEHAKEKGYTGIKAVYVTAKPGDIGRATGGKVEATQQENPSDIVVHFNKKPKGAAHGYLGASLKSSSSKKIGFHNGGAGTIGKELGLDLEGTANKMQDSFIKKKGLSKVKAQAQKQIKGEGEQKRNNPLYSEALSHASTIHTKVRDMMHDHYAKMPTEKVRSHLLKTFIKVNHDNALPYVKVHGQGGGRKDASAHTTDPSDNEEFHAIKKAKKIHFEKGGDSLLHVHADNKKVFTIQVKHNSGPLTSLKVLGQP